MSGVEDLEITDGDTSSEQNIDLFVFEFLPTVYVVRREGYVLTRVCLSVHTWGGTLARSGEGVHPAGVYPTSGYPPLDLAGGFLIGGTTSGST